MSNKLLKKCDRFLKRPIDFKNQTEEYVHLKKLIRLKKELRNERPCPVSAQHRAAEKRLKLILEQLGGEPQFEHLQKILGMSLHNITRQRRTQAVKSGEVIELFQTDKSRGVTSKINSSFDMLMRKKSIAPEEYAAGQQFLSIVQITQRQIRLTANLEPVITGGETDDLTARVLDAKDQYYNIYKKIKPFYHHGLWWLEKTLAGSCSVEELGRMRCVGPNTNQRTARNRGVEYLSCTCQELKDFFEGKVWYG